MKTGTENFIEALKRTSSAKVSALLFQGDTTESLRHLSCLIDADLQVSIPDEEKEAMDGILKERVWSDSLLHIFHVRGLSGANESWVRHILEGVDRAVITT